ncbi:lipopolysaccharide-induced tumor necrosis factor-alpha factor homolog isoform X2 [Onthophagus taurus]|nr:cell death-inducing p53-target protein 1 homolog [Onthophagus taurus]
MEGIPAKGDEGFQRVPPPPYTAKPEDPLPNIHYPQQPPPPGFVPPNDGPSSASVTVVQALQLDSTSQMVHCAHCGVTSMTTVQAKPNTMTHTMALVMCCFVCWPCAWIPYACDSCQSIHHYCSNCNAYIGEYRG